MKKNRFAALCALLILTASVLFTGCEAGGNGETQNEANTSKNTTAAAATTADTKQESADTSEDTSDLFTERDLLQTADLTDAETITVSDRETVRITEAGVYVLTGNAQNACVLVEAGDDDKVQLVLDGLTIENTSQPCILVESADKVFLTSASGSENALTVSGSFQGDEDAVIYSTEDLVLQGLGTVTVTSTKDGIRTNDDLKLTGGTWTVKASDTALKAHDSILAYDGVYTLTGGSDGLHAEDNDDDTTGFIVIQGGSFTIKAGDDGVHATTTVTINGGKMDITAAEGIEATQVILNSGAVNIQATDDGVNAGKKSNSLNVKIEINGGNLTIVMGAGDTDAVDSNGDLVITGGTINITAQSAFDCDGSITHTGGTIIVNGVETDTVTNQMMGGPMGNQMGGFGGKRR